MTTRVHIYKVKAKTLRKLVSDFPTFGRFLTRRAFLRRSHFCVAFEKLIQL